MKQHAKHVRASVILTLHVLHAAAIKVVGMMYITIEITVVPQTDLQ